MSFRDIVSKLREVENGDVILPEDKNELNFALRELARAFDVINGKLVLKELPLVESLRCAICDKEFERGSLILFMVGESGLVPVHVDCVRSLKKTIEPKKKRGKLRKLQIS